MVLVPYKITLLSNEDAAAEMAASVLVPYKITLLSNHKWWKYYDQYGFSTL